MSSIGNHAKSRTQQSWEFECPDVGGLVVGVDGSPASIAALNTASALSRAHRLRVHVVSVLAPLATYHLDPGAGESQRNAEALHVSIRESAMRQLMDLAGDEGAWTCEAVFGTPPKAITQIAEARCADFIVIGRHHYALIERIMEGETTLQIMRRSPVPVLAVTEDLDAVKSVVIATDFSPGSVRAAKAALRLLGRSGTMYLTYVEPPVELLPAGFAVAGDTRYPGDVVVWFRRFIESLRVPPGVVVDSTILNGKPVPAVLEFSERVGADLVAAGAHALSRLDRLLLGSVSTGLVRNAKCAVLIAPPGD